MHWDQKHISIYDSDKNEKAKSANKYVIIGKLKFEEHKHCLEAIQLDSKIKQARKKQIWCGES